MEGLEPRFNPEHLSDQADALLGCWMIALLVAGSIFLNAIAQNLVEAVPEICCVSSVINLL